MTPHAMPFRNARMVMLDALERRAFPAAVVEVGTPETVLWREAFGSLTYEAGAAPAQVDTVFDLASLTKVIATTTIVMDLVERGRLDSGDPIRRWIPQWSGADRRQVTIEDALSHATGLPAWLPLFREHDRREEFQEVIARTALDYPPRRQSVYSDLGFMLLGFVAEYAGGGSLERLFDSIRSRLRLEDLVFRPPDRWRPRIAPTEYDTWRGCLLVGDVHDENAAALGGAAGHAGLFGTARAVGGFAQWLLRVRTRQTSGEELRISAATVDRFTTRGNVPGSSRALGWDTMLPSSSCGRRMSPLAFGHTGFTGTSLWIDPRSAVYVVLLTNRVHPSRDNELIKQVRPAFHDAVMAEGLGI
jgi:CubicO group peptidase (beta-lactamase class C family)